MAWIYPVPLLKDREPRVTSRFGEPRDGGARSHQGVDILFPRLPGEPENPPWGSAHYITPTRTPAIAVGPGVVKYAEVRPKGHAVRINHGEFDTLYIHLTNLLVRAGQVVKAGQPVGLIGDDPTNPRDPAHLHFEVRKNNIPQNPEIFLADTVKIQNPHATSLLDALVIGAMLYGGLQLLKVR